MGYDRDAPKRAVSFSLNEDLVRQAGRYTLSLDRTLETLLVEYVKQEQARRDEQQAELNRFLDAWNIFHAEHGLLSDEFCDL